MRGCGRNVADVLIGIVIQTSVYVCFSHVSVWPRGHCLPGKSGPSSRTVCEEQLISSDQSCPHSQPPPLPERKINCTHAVNKNKKKILQRSLTQPLQMLHRDLSGGICMCACDRNSLAWWDISRCQKGASHDEQPRRFSPSSTKPNKHLFPSRYTASVMGAYRIPDNTVTMSMEGNYILNVLFLHSAPGGENLSVAPADCMEKSCFLKPSNTTIYVDIKTGRAARDICGMVN